MFHAFVRPRILLFKLTQSVSYSPPHTTATAWAHSKLHMIYNEYVWQSVMSAIATATNGINYFVVCSAIFHLPPNKCTHFRFVHRNLFRKIFSRLFHLVVQVHRNRFRSMPTWVQSEQCVRSRLKRTHIQFHFNLCVGELLQIAEKNENLSAIRDVHRRTGYARAEHFEPGTHADRNFWKKMLDELALAHICGCSPWNRVSNISSAKRSFLLNIVVPSSVSLFRRPDHPTHQPNIYFSFY